MLTFSNFCQQFVAAFPELRTPYERLAVDDVFGNDGQPGQYMLTELLFAYYIEVLLAMPDNPRRNGALHNAFGFIEAMLASEDDEIAGLAQIGLIEGRDQWWFQRALPFVGPLWKRYAAGERDWEPAMRAGPAAPPAPDRDLIDLFGVREVIADQLAPEGVSLNDVPGTTHIH